MKQGTTTTFKVKQFDLPDITEIIFSFTNDKNNVVVERTTPTTDDGQIHKSYPSEVSLEDGFYKIGLDQEETLKLNETFYVEAQIMFSGAVTKAYIDKVRMPHTFYTKVIDGATTNGEEIELAMELSDVIEIEGGGSDIEAGDGLKRVGNVVSVDIRETEGFLAFSGAHKLQVNYAELGKFPSFREYLADTSFIGSRNALASKQYVDNLISGRLKRLVVQTLPTQDIDTNTIYMILKTVPSTNNIYDEYMYINNAWELIGSTEVDLSNYYTKTESDNKYQNKLTVGNGIDITSDVISAKISGSFLMFANNGLTINTSVLGSSYALRQELANGDSTTFALASKSNLADLQPKLTAGTNITIDSNNVISASGGSYTFTDGLTESSGTVGLDIASGSKLLIDANDKLDVDLSSKQDTIDSTHKLSADLVTDASATNKFVPSHSSTESGKVLGVDTNGDLEWTTSGGGSSDTTYSSLKIVCMGDSLTEGDYGSNPPGTENVQDKNYPYFLGRYFNSNNVVNLGKCGLSASSYWTNYIQNHESDLYRADVVVIFLGANYYLTNTLAEDTNYDDYNDYANTTTGNYCKIIEWTMEKTNDFTQICLVTLPYLSPTMRPTENIIATNDVIKQIGAKYSIPVFDLYNEGGFSKFNLDFNSPIDGLHFGYYGYQRLATYIGSKIKGQLTYLLERHQTQPITYSLVHTTSTNTDTTATNTYSTHLTIDEGYSLTGVTVYMGGLDVTDEVYDSATHDITINDVRGAIVIQAIASEGDPYTPVDAIITGGHHAINTGKMMIPNAKLEFEFQQTESVGGTYICGSFTSFNVNRISMLNDGIISFSSGVTLQAVKTKTNVGTNNRNIKFSNDGVYYDDEKYDNVTVNNMTGTLPIYLGAVNYGGTLTAGSKVKLKKWKWYDGNGNLVQDLIPVLDENGEPCMYDTVTQAFFYNIGSGQFGYELNGNIVEPT